MVIASPPIQEFNSVSQWFELQIKALNLSAPTPDLTMVKDVLQRHLPVRVNRFSRHISEPESAANWLEIILKLNALVRLWPSPEQPITVAIDCSGNLKLAQEQLELVRSPSFCTTRSVLGIDRHVFLVVPGFPLRVPKGSELLDALYAQAEDAEACAIVVL